MNFAQDASKASFKYGIRSTNVLLENYFEPVEAIILIEDEKIFEVIVVNEANPEQLQAIQDQWKIENYGSLCIFPGIIDSNVHLHTNFNDEWDNVTVSTKLAAAGGVTTIVDNPVMTKSFETPEEYLKILEEKIKLLRSKSNVDFGIFGVLEPKTQEVIDKVIDLGVLGLKCYLFNCLQSDVGHIPPEYLEGLLNHLSESYPNLLLIFHPEVATERELYLTSPCRLGPLENRLDLNFEIKSLELGGGANKGAYMEEFEKDGFSDDYEDDDCPTPCLDTPSKLRSKVKKCKEKTEINQLVHYELMSYQYEEGKNDIEGYSSDSDLEITDSASQSPCMRVKKIPSQEKPNEKGFSFELNPVPCLKPAKKSLFNRDEIKESPAEDFDTTPKVSLQLLSQHSVTKRSLFSSNREQEVAFYTEASPVHSPEKTFYEDKSPRKKSPLAIPHDGSPSEKRGSAGKKNRSSSLVITSLSKVSKLLEEATNDDRHSNENLDTASTKSPIQANEKDQDTTDDLNKLSGSSRLGSGLSNECKVESSSSGIMDPSRKLTVSITDGHEKTENLKSADEQVGFSPDFNNNFQEFRNGSPLASPCFSNDNTGSESLSLLQRRNRKASLNIPIGTKGTVVIVPTKVSNAFEVVKSPVKPKKVDESMFNTSYRVFLANRPQSWEENGVSLIISKLKPDTNLRVMIQNLSLASSLLKIRQKKKKEPQFLKSLYGDTSVAYLFFNEKTVKTGETKYKATPPFRDNENRKLLLDNFKLDGIDLVSSYHFFVPEKYKEVDHGNFRRAFNGFDSIGFNLQSLWTSIYMFYKKNNKRFTQEPFYQKKLVNDALCRICKVLCHNPAEFLKIDNCKGKIAKGKDADFVVWDPYKLIHNQNLPSNHIFSKRILYGVVNKTYIRGKLVYDKEGDVAKVSNFKANFVSADF